MRITAYRFHQLCPTDQIAVLRAYARDLNQVEQHLVDTPQSTQRYVLRRWLRYHRNRIAKLANKR